MTTQDETIVQLSARIAALEADAKAKDALIAAQLENNMKQRVRIATLQESVDQAGTDHTANARRPAKENPDG